MPIGLTFLRDLFDAAMANGDAVDPPLSSANRDMLINEALLDYQARYAPLYDYTADIVSAANPLSVRTDSLGYQAQWIDQFEWKSGGRYFPLKRAEERTIGLLRATEDAVGNPTSYGAVLQGRVDVDQAITQSLWSVRVYPRPSGSQTYRARMVRFHNELLTTNVNTDPALIDSLQAEHVARIAAFRAGTTLGYDDAWLESQTSMLPDGIKAVLSSQYKLQWLAPRESVPWPTIPKA